MNAYNRGIGADYSVSLENIFPFPQWAMEMLLCPATLYH